MTQNNSNPHDNPHWERIRDERDVQRMLEGKPLSENSNFKTTRAPNIWILIFKMLQIKQIRRDLWRGFWLSIFKKDSIRNSPDLDYEKEQENDERNDTQ